MHESTDEICTVYSTVCVARYLLRTFNSYK